MPATIVSVAVRGAPLANGVQLVADLRNLGPVLAHHSHPTTAYVVTIQSARGPLVLVLGRDSDHPREYWVFYGGFYSTKNNEVGRVFTSALDPPPIRPLPAPSELFPGGAALPSS